MQVLAPFAIGMVVFLAHTVAIPIDGCSVNRAPLTHPSDTLCMFNPGKLHLVREAFTLPVVFLAIPTPGVSVNSAPEMPPLDMEKPGKL